MNIQFVETGIIAHTDSTDKESYWSNAPTDYIFYTAVYSDDFTYSRSEVWVSAIRYDDFIKDFSIDIKISSIYEWKIAL